MSVTRDQVIKAIKALQQFQEKSESSNAKSKKASQSLTENEEYIFVTASLYRVPKPHNTLPIPM